MANLLMGKSNDPIGNIINFLDNGGSPQQILNNLFPSNNFQQIQSMVNGKNPKQMVMELAKQRGIDINQIEELAKRLGAK